MLYLVGEGFDKQRANYLRRQGRIKRVARGIFVDAGDDPAQVIRAHALRIAHYLYPGARLMGRSALRRGPDGDGHLLLAGEYKHARDLPGLTITIREAPGYRNDRITLDGGESIEASSVPQAILEGYHFPGAEPDAQTLGAATAGMTEADERTLVLLAGRTGWTRALDRYERARDNLSQRDVAQEHVVDVPLFWHGSEAARLRYDGIAWSFDRNSGFLVPLAAGARSAGALDGQIESLMPEGWLAGLVGGDDRKVLSSAPRRLLSNLETGAASGIDERIVDGAELSRFIGDGVFTGASSGLPDAPLAELHHRLARWYGESDHAPMMSGAQVTVPLHLDPDGRLEPAIDRPFTHLWKAPGTGAGGWTALGAVEWLGMELTRAAGVPVPEYALLPHRPGVAPGLLVERFDLRRGGERDWIVQTDLCALLGLPSGEKYAPSMEKVAKAVMRHSTSPEQDGETLFRQTLVAWLMANGDLHAKNLSMLRRAASPAQDRWDTVRLSPSFDMLCTRVFPGLEGDQMALPLGGKRENLKRAQWRTLGGICRMGRERVDDVMDEVAESVACRARDCLSDLPEPIACDDECRRVVLASGEILADRLGEVSPELRDRALPPSEDAGPPAP